MLEAKDFTTSSSEEVGFGGGAGIYCLGAVASAKSFETLPIVMDCLGGFLLNATYIPPDSNGSKSWECIKPDFSLNGAVNVGAAMHNGCWSTGGALCSLMVCSTATSSLSSAIFSVSELESLDEVVSSTMSSICSVEVEV
ncbi:uncharacterized protein G2W53_044796 [Senna tora]|uniref:Uncharacterized protein n=1 Tax=Senna tora TaxID=362788 RepID=A0A834SF42_9FABA|nr:uncharacterized protein G2W53_044796 [Senna tora]